MWNYLAFDVNYSQFLVAQAVFVAVPKLSLNTAKYDLRDSIKTFPKVQFWKYGSGNSAREPQCILITYVINGR